MRAWLFSDSLGRFTLHEYAGTAPCSFTPDRGDQTPAEEILYRCAETGAVRRWGVE